MLCERIWITFWNRINFNYEICYVKHIGFRIDDLDIFPKTIFLTSSQKDVEDHMNAQRIALEIIEDTKE